MKRGLIREEFCLYTPCDPLTVRVRLRGRTLMGEQDDREKQDPAWTGELPYTGESFQLRPICYGRNSWLPVWCCTLSGGPEGSRLEVRARCCLPTRVFLTAWFVLLSLITLAGVWEALHSGRWWGMAPTLPFWLFGLGLSGLAFWLPERRARERLCRILQGKLE